MAGTPVTIFEKWFIFQNLFLFLAHVPNLLDQFLAPTNVDNYVFSYSTERVQCVDFFQIL